MGALLSLPCAGQNIGEAVAPFWQNPLAVDVPSCCNADTLTRRAVGRAPPLPAEVACQGGPWFDRTRRPGNVLVTEW